MARLAAALSAVPRAVSEDAPDAAPVGTDRSVAPTRSGAARLDTLLLPSDRGERHEPRPPAVAATRTVPLSERTPEAEVRAVPQPLRLVPDPTTTVWCADLLGGSADDDGAPTLLG